MRYRMLFPLILFAAAPAAAQSNATGPVVVPPQLTLEEAIRITLSNNISYLQSLNQQVGLNQTKDFRFTRMLPIPGADISTRLAPARSTSPAGTSTSKSSSTSLNASLSFTIWDRGASLTAYRQSKLQVDRGTISLAQQELNARSQVINQYYSTSQAARSVELEKQLLVARKAEVEDADLRFRNTLIGVGDMINAQQAVRDQENNVLNAQDAFEKAKLSLLATMGVMGSTDFTLATPIPEIPENVRLDADSIVQLAFDRNLQLKVSEKNLESARMSANQTKRAKYFPSVSASVSFGRSVSQPDYAAFFDPEGRNTSLSGSLQFGISLRDIIDVPAMRLNTQQANSSVYDATLNFRNQRLDVERSVRAAVIDLQAAYRTLEHQRSAVRNKQEQVDIANEELRAGKITHRTFQQIVDDAAATERRQLDAQLNVLTRKIALDVLLGVRPGG